MRKSQTTTREPETFGYVRVSTKEQNIDRQLIALEPFGIPPANLFVEKKSGKNLDRPRYKQMLRRLRKGDLVYFCELDRLGRNYEEIIEQWRFITREKGADIKVLEMPLLDTTLHKDLLGTFIADIVLSFLSFFAQKEREKTLQRQAEGIAAAKAKGVVFGRKAVDIPNDFEEIYRQWRDKALSNEAAAKLCGFSVRTLYSLTAEWRALESE
jgi:DNA invertase Pin-like site-specific DNA recombinase